VTSEAVHTVLVGGETAVENRKCTRFDEQMILAEIAEEAERYRRETRRQMDKAAAPLLPHLRRMYQRAIETPGPSTCNPRVA
jgi:hypothetical protein